MHSCHMVAKNPKNVLRFLILEFFVLTGVLSKYTTFNALFCGLAVL